MPNPIGWITLLQAESYFASERLNATAWDGLSVTSTKNEKEAVLLMAYNRLFYCGLFDLPTFASASAAQLIVLQKAQCEMAYYLALHSKDEDRRKGLHAQGVVGSNLVGETYVRFASDAMSLSDLPIPAFVAHLLKDYSTDAAPFYAVDIDRREDESVDTNVVGLDDNEY
jgi:hypothetical protein